MVTTPCPLPPLDPDRARIHPLADYIPPFAKENPSTASLAAYVGAWTAEASAMIDDAITGAADALGLDVMRPRQPGEEAVLGLRLIAMVTGVDFSVIDMRDENLLPATIHAALDLMNGFIEDPAGHSHARRNEVIALRRALTSPINLIYRLPCGHVVAHAVALPFLSVPAIAEGAICALVSHDAASYSVAARNLAGPRLPRDYAYPFPAKGSNSIAAILDPSAVRIMRTHDEIAEVADAIHSTGRLPDGADVIAVDSGSKNFHALDADFQASMLRAGPGVARPAAGSDTPPVDGGGNFGPVSVSATARKLH